VKAVMAGADVVQVTSTLLRHGPSRLTYLRTQFDQWCERHQFSVAGLKGCARPGGGAAGARFQREDYVSVLQSWNPDQLPLTD